MTREGWGQNIYGRMLFNSRGRLWSEREGGGRRLRQGKDWRGGGKGQVEERGCLMSSKNI